MDLLILKNCEQCGTEYVETRLINGSRVNVKDLSVVDGYEQFSYLSGYGLWLRHCTCGGGGVIAPCVHLRDSNVNKGLKADVF